MIIKARTGISYSQEFIARLLETTTSGTDWYNGSKYPMAYALDYCTGKKYYAPQELIYNNN